MIQFDWKGARLKSFLKKNGVSVQRAAEMLGVSRQTVYQYFNSDQLTREVVNKILTTFGTAESEIFEVKVIPGSENLNFENDSLSAIKGKSIALHGFKNAFQNEFIDLNNGNLLLVTPLIEGYLRAKFLNQLLNQNLMLSDFPSQSIIVDKFQKGEFLSFRVVGSAMDDGTSQSILAGSIVTGQKMDIDLLKSRFSFPKNEDFVIVHKEGVLIKRIANFNPESGQINCLSLNPDKETFPDHVLNIQDCLMIFLIVNVSVSRGK